MLSRVADSLYWMSRYLERGEHTARLVDVHLNLMLDQTAASAGERWMRVLAAIGNPVAGASDVEPYALAQTLTFDTSNHASVAACIISARENARQVREQISSEMWEELNRVFHEVKRADLENLWETEPLEFLRVVKDGVHLFQGITDSTMSHGEGWQFIQFGQYIERASSIAALLDVHSGVFPTASNEIFDQVEWIGLLRGCTAFESYCRVYTPELKADRIAEFLLLNAEFPHSIRFSVDRVRASLEAIQEFTNSRKADHVSRLAGRLRALLGYGQIHEIVAGGLHAYLMDIQRQCAEINRCAHELYVSYPIEAALEI